MPEVARFLVLATEDVPLQDTLVAVLGAAYEAVFEETLSDAELANAIRIEHAIAVAPTPNGAARTLTRFSLVLEMLILPPEYPSPEGLVNAFAQELAEAVGLAEPGSLHTLKFSEPDGRKAHTTLYQEIYEIEMGLREVLSYIVLQEFPDHPYTFLDRTKVATTTRDLNRDYFVAHHENQLFHIQFDQYEHLNTPGSVKLDDLVRRIRAADTFDTLRDLVGIMPITGEVHAGFVASLERLLAPIEVVRNCVAHSRAVPRRAYENYGSARTAVHDAIATFWLRVAT